ncbi:MAG: pyridine nucleotide-disulfide oxidoreductase, partial [Alistipes sp.]|nr:pyridine nucleotide-disulfide oxidoreductase [Alistipes sp.]
MKKVLFTLLALLSLAACSTQPDASLWVETEGFAQKGGWSVDQQFTFEMGSPYLIAHGMGQAVEDASTTITLPRAGKYHVWVRTYNWTSPWSETEGPGAFKLSVDGKELPTTLGTKGNKWMWQYA